MEASEAREWSTGKNRSFRHVPPTAVPAARTDLWSGLAALADREGALERFRSALMNRAGSSHCYLVSSGRAALTVILMGLKRLNGGSRVILPAYGCPTVPQAVLSAGLQPVFCDVCPETLDLDASALKRLVSKDVLAIVQVHLYGLAQDVEPLLEMGREHEIFLIEDAAQAFGATLRGCQVGTIGDAGLYSLGRGKCLPTGHGGVIVAQERCAAAIGEVIRESVRPSPSWDVGSLALFLGYGLATHPRGWWFVTRSPLDPARRATDLQSLRPIRLTGLSAVQAGIGASILGRVDAVQAVRRRNASLLMNALSGFYFVSFPEISQGAEPVFLRLPIVVDDEERADRLLDLLRRRGIGAGRPYRIPLPYLLDDAPQLEDRDFPGASLLSSRLLTLPTHPYLDEDDIDRIAGTFRACDEGRF
jgi:perosamine synthetase